MFLIEKNVKNKKFVVKSFESKIKANNYCKLINRGEKTQNTCYIVKKGY
jgi:hypothetical protein